jgi:UDP-2-acetamido-3-amino-2,3-dideoxy-glucuronate N-acetyltransferase
MSNFYAHPSAEIDTGCTIRDDTKIWHFCHLMPGCSIGARCILGQNVFVASDVVLGNGVKVQNNVSLYAGVTCEDEVFIGPSAVFTNVINPRSAIERKDQYRPTLVQRGASIGANATILCGITIGAYALIGAAAVVTKGVPPFALLTGNPARQQGWVSKAGHRLHFDAENLAICPETGEHYLLMDGHVSLQD